MFRAPMLHLDQDLYELHHLRIRLDVPDKSRRRRRTLRQNRQRFRLKTGPPVVDEEARRLYELTRPRFMGFVVRDVADVAVAEMSQVFDTRELRVYDHDRLVALSYFDMGKRAMASILGLRDPQYARHSLGVYTMLEEMALGREAGMRHFYPGYVAVGMSGFDYKHRLGATQYMDRSGRWRARVTPPRDASRQEHAVARMDSLQHAIHQVGLRARRRLYPAFWLGRLPGVGTAYLRAMWHVCCDPGRRRRRSSRIIEYLTDEDLFVVCRAGEVPGASPLELLEPNPCLEAHCDTRLLAYEEVLLKTRCPEEAAQAMMESVTGVR